VIAFLHGARAFGAVERYVEGVVRGLEEEAVLVHPGVPEFERLGVRTVVVSPASAPATAIRLARLLRRLRPRLAHATDVWPPALVAARLAGIRRVLVTHHTPELPRTDNLAGRLWWRVGWATRPEVIYTSESDRERDGRSGLKTHVVELGIDVDRFAAGTPVLAKHTPIVGNVARLAEQKGHRYLLEAVPHVAGARFVIAGDGELHADLERRARDLGVGERVDFLGARDDVPDLLASFDVFAFPSLFEGLCVAVIEAQAAAVPVVATPVGGIRETVIDGETGLLVPPRDPVALAAAIRRLLQDRDLATRLAANAKPRVRERFSTQTMVEKTLAVYNGAGPHGQG
jgi:glycosyltransferase involved in cell wall biosynthesis